MALVVRVERPRQVDDRERKLHCQLRQTAAKIEKKQHPVKTIGMPVMPVNPHEMQWLADRLSSTHPRQQPLLPYVSGIMHGRHGSGRPSSRCMILRALPVVSQPQRLWVGRQQDNRVTETNARPVHVGDGHQQRTVSTCRRRNPRAMETASSRNARRHVCASSLGQYDSTGTKELRDILSSLLINAVDKYRERRP